MNSTDNPNEEVSNCGMCSTVVPVGTDAIGCDMCPLWFHPTPQCTGLSQSSIDCILNEGGDALRFVCAACRCNTSSGDRQSGGNNAVHGDTIGQLFQLIRGLAVTVAQLVLWGNF